MIAGVAMPEPKQPSCAKPMSSSTITTTFGAPGFGRGNSVGCGVESAIVVPIVPIVTSPLVGGPLARREPGQYPAWRGRRSGAARRPAWVLRRRRDGDQGARLDGPGLRAAGVLLPRDRPQPAGGRAVPRPGRDLRRRHRRGARPARRSCCRPTARRPRWSPAPRADGGYVVDAVCPLVTKVHHEVKVRAGKGYRSSTSATTATRRRSARSPSRPSDPPGRVDRRDRRAAASSTGPVALLAQTTLATATGRASPTHTRDRFPDVWMPGRNDLCFATTNRQARARGDRRTVATRSS